MNSNTLFALRFVLGLAAIVAAVAVGKYADMPATHRAGIACVLGAVAIVAWFGGRRQQ